MTFRYEVRQVQPCVFCENLQLADCYFNGVPVCANHVIELSSREKIKKGLPLNEVEAQYDDAKNREKL